jgi:hypothetical protein
VKSAHTDRVSVALRLCPAIATKRLLLDRLQHESLEIGVAHDAGSGGVGYERNARPMGLARHSAQIEVPDSLWFSSIFAQSPGPIPNDTIRRGPSLRANDAMNLADAIAKNSDIPPTPHHLAHPLKIERTEREGVRHRPRVRTIEVINGKRVTVQRSRYSFAILSEAR